ncbi:PAS domain-containing protein [Microvirga sp. VF16]|uniref:PAS domain-containing protein n=1 Tax=Microvirga sp. VF16 TaxID=2807101 RepID=UPI00193CAD95|nr:PAS domain-containing protein [Microvirga sp. VF16]QRM28191.1 PAS domain-containing protein [Microvirga sp. VF16]
MTNRVEIPHFPRAVAPQAERLAGTQERSHAAIESDARGNSAALRLALEIGRLGSWERDLVTNEITANSTCKAHLGLASDELLTFEKLKKLQHPGDVERINQAVTYALATRSDFNVEHRVVRPDGYIGRLRVRGTPIFENGKAVRLVGVTQDVTERERAKEELKDVQRRQDYLLNLNEQLRSFKDPFAIMEATTERIGQLLKADCVGYGEVDDSRGVVLVEREWSRGAISNEGRAYRLQEFLHGMIDDSKLGQTLTIEDVATDPRTGTPALQSFYSTLNARAVLTVPLLKDGHITAVLYTISSTPRSWSDSDVSLAEDVAERAWTAVEKLRAERSLHETEFRFHTFTRALPGFAWIATPELELIYYVNEQSWFEFSGLSREQTLGHGWLSIIHPEDLAKIMADAKNATSDVLEAEMRYRAADGTYHWHAVRVGSLYGPDGDFKGKIGTSINIHNLKETEAALRKSEERLALAQRAARIGVFDWDVASGAITWMPEQENLFGIAPGSFEGNYEGWSSRIHPADVAKFEKTFREAIARGDHELAFAHRIPLPDSTFRHIEGSMMIFYGEDGSPSRIIGVNIDVTKHKHAEQRQQLLIRELHHRVKNTLATVQAIVGSTARTASSIDEFYQGFVGRIVSLARTHNLLTEDLWQKADLEELVQTELGPYEDEARNRITVAGPPLELPSEAAVPIGMAIHELTTNAAKHGALSTFGGQVAVRWEILDRERPLLQFSWIEKGGPRVSTPTRQGFGTRLLQRVLATQLQANVSMDFPEEGLRFSMQMPIPTEPPTFNPDT